MNRKSHFPNHILLLHESALLVVSEAFLGLSPHLFFPHLSISNTLLRRAVGGPWRVTSAVKCCYLQRNVTFKYRLTSYPSI